MHSPLPLSEADTIRAILQRYRSVAVVGLSPKPHRDSYGVARYMQVAGWKIIPINPVATEILGEKAYPSLQAAAQEHPIELVDVFRNAADVPPVVEDAIAVGAQAIWLQLGISHDAALARARTAGLLAVQNRCLKVDHRNQV